MRISQSLTNLLLTLTVLSVLAVSALAQQTLPGTPGNPLPENSAAPAPVSDQKPGSVLFYNYYTSSTTSATETTLFNMTNTSTVQDVLVHLFFVEGRTCGVRDAYVCLTRNQTLSFKAVDYDPDTSGYLLAVATDSDGCPIRFNFLIGDEYIRTSGGFAANLAAESIGAVAPVEEVEKLVGNNGSAYERLPGCDPTSAIAVLAFNGTVYNRVPLVLALDNISNVNDTETLLILNRVGGDLTSTAASIGSIFGLLYDDIERQLSWQYNSGRCQAVERISDSFPLTAPRFSSFLTRTGWMKFYSTSGNGLLGAVLVRPKTGAGYFQGHNLHKLTYTSMRYIIPAFPNACNQSIL